MNVVSKSKLLEILQVPSLGNYETILLESGKMRCFVKKGSEYKCKWVEMNHFMRLHYKNDKYEISLTNSEDCENIYLAYMLVTDRGKGLGTDLLNNILDYCDENGYKLFLHPFPIEYTDDKFNTKKSLSLFFKLRDWYKSFGFIEQNDGYMVYHPNTI